VTLFVDTSVWSLALRRDAPADADAAASAVHALQSALDRGDAVCITGLVLQELLQGFSSPRAREKILDHLSALPLLVPDWRDHVEAADLRNRCRRAGLQVGTIDALLAALCIRHELVMLSTDDDFRLIASREKLRLWHPGPAGRSH
jgi:predicted nucleic acid-binding protein